MDPISGIFNRLCEEKIKVRNDALRQIANSYDSKGYGPTTLHNTQDLLMVKRLQKDKGALRRKNIILECIIFAVLFAVLCSFGVIRT